MIARFCLALSLCLSCVAFSQAQTTPSGPAAAVWNALANPAMDNSKLARVSNIEIVRDRAHITLTDGTILFTQPVNGVVTGAVFRGNGRIQMDPPNPIEAQQLRLFTNQDKLNMTFTQGVFIFTDGLYDEIAAKVKWESTPLNEDLHTRRFHEREDLGAGILPRLVQSVLSTDKAATAYFLADLKTDEKNWIEVKDDRMEAEDISVGRWVNLGGFRNFDVWMSFPAGKTTSAEAWADPQAKQDFSVTNYKIVSEVTTGAELHATATVDVQPRLAGQSLMVFSLDSNLRVDSVKDPQGNAFSFIQARETKDRLQSYGDYVAVMLPQPSAKDKPLTFVFSYGGKRAIRKAGNGNYFCESSGWYPEHGYSFADRTNFDLTFRSPKNDPLVATGVKTSDTVDGNTRITTWKSEIPMAVAGFGYGDYKTFDEKANQVDIQVYANREPDEVMQSVQRYIEARGDAAVGEMSPAAMAKTMGQEMGNTIRVFENYFGPYPYKQLAVTSMPISYSYGQGWPGLIYLWSASFLDSTQRNALGFRDHTGVTDFFRAHEASHQWWGHRVGWKSYHDQWLSEGFAEFSGNLYVQYRQNMKEYINRWKKEKENLKHRDEKGHTVDSLGPIWMGQRIASSETNGGSYQDLIYSKGGYVLHMLRVQLQDPRNPDPDHLFKDMMHDYCNTFNNKPASTEDFKGIVEKHMTQGMDLDGNRKMDWFFNQYVYGMGTPQYTFNVKLESTPDGKTKITGTLNRTGVPDSWKDVVPLYAHVGDKTVRLGTIAAVSASQPVNAVVPGKIDRITINDLEDLLAEVKQ